MKRRSNQLPRGGRERSQRQLRVGELVRHALVGILGRDSVRDPDLAGVAVTVTEVRVSPDLRNATVFVVPLGGANMDTVVNALRRAAPYLRRLLADQVTTKRLPTLNFEPDTSFDNVARIERLLDPAGAAADGAAGAGEDGTDSDGP